MQSSSEPSTRFISWSRRSLLKFGGLAAATAAIIVILLLLNREPTPVFRIHRDIAFAQVDDRPLLLDLYLPTDHDPPPPVIVWLHGGGWQYGDKEHNPLRWTAMEGYASVTVNYRLTPGVTFPAPLHDCKAVVRWLRANQDRYGFDARRIVVAGSSAGGHLAALLATTGGDPGYEGAVGGHLNQSSRVQGLLCYSAPTDLTVYRSEPGKDLTDAVTLLLGVAPAQSPDQARAASPLHQLDAADPPMLIVHAVGDPVVDAEHSRRLHEKGREQGVESKLILLPVDAHDTPMLYDGDRREEVRAFLNHVLRQPSQGGG